MRECRESVGSQNVCAELTGKGDAIRQLFREIFF